MRLNALCGVFRHIAFRCVLCLGFSYISCYKTYFIYFLYDKNCRTLRKLIKNKIYMRTYKFTGYFRSQEGHEYVLNVNCMSFIEAFFLLTADAIRTGQHYQLNSIQKEDGSKRFVDDILKCASLLS